MRPKPAAAMSALCLLLLVHAACNRSARRVDAVSGVLDAFASHQIVALGEGLHGNNEAHAFRLALIRDPRFPEVANDVVVEFGSARYQTVMDAFVAGAEVPSERLRKAWQDTTNPSPIWDTPIYEAFFRALRDVNASLPSHRKLRVLLGEPPIEWENVRTQDDLTRWMGRRGRHAADLIQREVLLRKRRALVIYGDAHFRRYSKWIGIDGPPSPTLLNLIERQGTRAFSIWTNTTVQLERLQPDIADWPIPSLTRVRGTRLGTLSFYYFAGLETNPPTKMEEQYDAVLYLGPITSITMSQLPPLLCSDPEYSKMRLARMALGPGGPTGPGVSLFRKECGTYVLGLPR